MSGVKVAANWMFSKDDYRKLPVVTLEDSFDNTFRLRAGKYFNPDVFIKEAPSPSLIARIANHFKENLYTEEGTPFYAVYTCEVSMELREDKMAVLIRIEKI